MLVRAIIFIIIGFLLLIKGADYLVDGASAIGKKMHIPEIIIGLTIISLGTTMPELFVSTTSALNGYTDMAIGNAIGSIISNLLLILGLTTILQTIDLNKGLGLFEIPFSIIVLILFFILANTGLKIDRVEGIALLVILLGFVTFTIIRAVYLRKDEDKENKKEKEENISLLKSIIYLFIGIIALKIGGELTVTNATSIARYFNISEKIIGVTILAIGTSLPELCTCITAAIKKKSDIAVGNILGANLLNILLIIGVSATITPMNYNTVYNKDIIYILMSNIMLEMFVFFPPKDKMNAANGIVFIIMYLGYMLSLFV